MADRNQLANEKKALLDEAKTIETNANAQIEAIQKEAQEQLKPKSERIVAINQELLASIDEEAGIVND
jgi:ribosomal protein S25|tara:strand:- start:387 stop:590 length:204 start_codon:yes stop_codon:yes gene_type:complete